MFGKIRQIIKKVVEGRTQEEVESDIEWEKKKKKILLNCSVVCGIIGLVAGALFIALWYGDLTEIIEYTIAGLWMGVGFGGYISNFPLIPSLFKVSLENDGLGFALKSAFFIIFVLFFVLIWAGPIGFLVWILLKNRKIKKLENELAAVKMGSN